MQTTPGYTEPRLAERHASESGVLTAEAVAARLGGNRGLADPQPGARRPAWGRVSVSLWGQASGLFGARGRGGGVLVQGFVCNKIYPSQSVGLCSAVV